MRKELDEALCAKYPLIFKDRNADMRTTAMCWGLECGDGWYNIIDSWSNQIYKNGTPQAFAYGEGYLYAMIDKGHPTNIALWDTSQFTPSLYAKAVVDKIFTNAGFIIVTLLTLVLK